ncbi:MAG: hypothetical protein AAGH89_17660, partial [Verrucomicrobiota bacterium]
PLLADAQRRRHCADFSTSFTFYGCSYYCAQCYAVCTTKLTCAATSQHFALLTPASKTPAKRKAP